MGVVEAHVALQHSTGGIPMNGGLLFPREPLLGAFARSSLAFAHFVWFCRTIGDWYPERNIFQLFIAVTSGAEYSL